MDHKGQLSTSAVIAVVVALMTISIGGLLFSNIHGVTETQSSGTGTYTATTLLNTSFTDNDTDNTPTYWDNAKDNGAVNTWNSSGYITVTSTENELLKIDNGIWYQSLTVSDIQNGITAATSFKYRVSDNDNANSIWVRLILNKGTDNYTIFSENVTKENGASWATVDNDVSAYVTATGTYTLYLRAELVGKGGLGTRLIVNFDDASLTATTYSRSLAENIAAGVGVTGGDAFPLLLLLILVGVFIAIITIVKTLS